MGGPCHPSLMLSFLDLSGYPMAWALQLHPETPHPSTAHLCTAREPEDGTCPRDGLPLPAHHPRYQPRCPESQRCGTGQKVTRWEEEPAGASDPSAGNCKLPGPDPPGPAPQPHPSLTAAQKEIPALGRDPACPSCDPGARVHESWAGKVHSLSRVSPPSPPRQGQPEGRRRFPACGSERWLPLGSSRRMSPGKQVTQTHGGLVL